MVEQPTSSQHVDPAAGRDRPDVQHEASDLRLFPIVGIVVLLGVTLALAARGARWLLDREVARSTPTQQTVRLPAEPRLEPFEPAPGFAESFAAREEAAEASLHRYGPADEPGFVRIPVEQAMRALAKKLQASGPIARPDPKSRGLVGGGDPNSGRLLRGDQP